VQKKTITNFPSSFTTTMPTPKQEVPLQVRRLRMALTTLPIMVVTGCELQSIVAKDVI